MDHKDFMIREIQKELDLLFSTFDTKLLATMMMDRSCKALRAVHSAGLWTVQDVRAVVEETTADVYTPLPADKVPKICSTGHGSKDTLQ